MRGGGGGAGAVVKAACSESREIAGSSPALWHPGLEFRILCLEGDVISLISLSSGGSHGPLKPTTCTLNLIYFISIFAVQ